MSIRTWMGPTMIALGATIAPSCDDDGVTTPAPDDVLPLLIVGSDMGAQSQSLTIINSRAQPVTNAVVTVNSVTIPHAGDGLYQGRLPAASPAGSPFDLRVSADGAEVRGMGNVPEAPNLTAPETGTVFAPTDSISVIWTSTTSPDRFVVVATWLVAEEESSESFPAPGDTRRLKVAASDVPAETEVTFKVLAYNDGSFTGSALPASRMNIRGEGPSGAVITRDVGPLSIHADMGPLSHHIAVAQNGRDANDAVVTVNGIAMPRTNSGGYSGQLPEPVSAGSPLVLEVISDGATARATGTVPEAPVLTAPATGTVFALTDSITVTWTSATDPEGFLVAVGSVFPAFFAAPGSARELKIAASDVGLIDRNLIDVTALNSGSFTGRAEPGSRMNLWNNGIPNTVITILP